MLWLDSEGQILDCGESVRSMFGFERGELRGLPVAALLPALADTELLARGTINPHLAFLSRCATPFLAVRRDGSEHHCTLFLNSVVLPTGPALALIVCHWPQSATAGQPHREAGPSP